ncbi:hypothetical protein ACFYO2_40180 [Streptomyces sp. NPDC006602]|uniref:hypothetical protein n=1 Tax=Streptomyces sp. NPDC006602 TaxID=3364751 RepID=UPI0036ADFB6B
MDSAARLLAPSAAHPLGTDALGRDLLARLGHGALRTTGVALAGTVVCTLNGLLLGMAARFGAGLTEVASTMPRSCSPFSPYPYCLRSEGVRRRVTVPAFS